MAHRIIFVLIIISFLPACSEKYDLESQREEVEFILDDLLLAFESFDIKKHEELWTKDPDLTIFGLYQNSNYRGWNEFKDHLQQTSLRAEYSQFGLKYRSITIAEKGNTAWFEMIVDQSLFLRNGNEMNITDIRYSGVIEKRNGRWQIVQFHGSKEVNPTNIN